MTKANVNTAGRDELVNAGLRAEIADEILKLRRKGRITSVEALDELSGVGPTTREQLRKVLDFSDRAGNGEGTQEVQRGAKEAGYGLAEAAGSAGRGSAEAVASAARSGLQVLQRTASAVGELEREAAYRSAEGTAELGQALVGLVTEQTEHNLATLTALTGAVDWDQAAKAVNWDRVFQIQSEYLRASLERTARLTQRYLEVTQAVMTSATSAAERQAKMAA